MGGHEVGRRGSGLEGEDAGGRGRGWVRDLEGQRAGRRAGRQAGRRVSERVGEWVGERVGR